jgi:tetratricopeptide (TPR) repeat protein
MLRINKLFGLAVALGLVAGSVPLFGQTGGLTGKATLDEGTLCVKCPVIIERLDIKGHYPTKTDKKGNYVYVGLPIGNYKITLQDPTGRTLFYIQHHVGLGDPTEVNFDLKQEKAQVAKEQAANPQVQQQLQEQQKQQKQMAGLKQLFDQGQALYAQQKYTEAAAAFAQAEPVAKDKNLVIILAHEAESYGKAKEYDKAVATYQRAIQLSPQDASLYDGLGTVYIDQRKIPDAQQAFQKAAEVNPAGAGREYYNLGVIMVNSGKMDEASQALKKATDIDANNANAWYWYGMALLGKAQFKPDGSIVAVPGTAEAFQKYLQLDPKGQWATAAQASIEQISGKVSLEYSKKKKKKG